MEFQKYDAAEVPVQVPPGSNRRKHERADGPLVGTCTTPDGEMSISVSNISDGGCFVSQPNNVSPGEQLNLRIELPHGEPIITAAQVLSADAQQGFAVLFLDADAPETQAGQSASEPVLQQVPPVPLRTHAPTSATPSPVEMANDW